MVAHPAARPHRKAPARTRPVLTRPWTGSTTDHPVGRTRLARATVPTGPTRDDRLDLPERTP
ncbi:hypothetical protein CAE01nite_24030 [Cellulomonas aerilata]|uniref:Uncharacterized protein n=1 Tax=Cellulomonas aerilata TaxID=515326 RepID=A0A512DDY5_9CELL|nr:hypothetical protein CAE01nite_24030 [Cellulomonas aerilata]